jgi:hypothetical protein
MKGGVLSAIRRARFRYVTEKDLQDGLEMLFKRLGIPYQREVHLGAAGVIDFVIDGDCGLEVKIKGGRNPVLAQLERYAERDEVKTLTLVTARSQLTRMPTTIKGKSLYVADLAGSRF